MTKQKKKRLLNSLVVLPGLLLVSGVLFLNKQSVEAEALIDTPIIWSISDAVKPNETITISGYALYGDDLTVAYAPNTGIEPNMFNEKNEPQDCTYVPKSKLTTIDSENGTGLMFTLPNSRECGTYDFWVKANGVWSDGITLNATRPLYLNQEATYAGLPIEVVGRNFFQSEYGVGTVETSLQSLQVKLVRVADVDGVSDGIACEATVGVESGIRYTAEQSVTGEAITESNPYKITFLTPNVEHCGTYEVFVAADGIDFRGLEENQQLIIYPKKAQSWDESVFGSLTSNTHIGNDPLDLQVYWAQDLNYTNIETIAPNTADDITLGTKIAQAAARLNQKGGGVVYFPAGDYYLTQCSSFYENIIWVGAGTEQTKVYYSDENSGGGSWIKASGVSNVGFARMTFTQEDREQKIYPDAIINLTDIDGKTEGGATDVSLQTSKNKFITDVIIDFPYDSVYDDGRVITNQRRYCHFSGAKNLIFQNVQYEGSDFPMNCNIYEYVNIRNAKLYSNDTNSFMSVMSNYAFLENVLFEKDWHGHGISLRNNASVSNCYVSKVGDPTWEGNIGEALLFEPAPGYYSVGTVASATARTFTVNMFEGTEITDAAPTLACNNFAIQIVGGKGSGQIRYFKRSPIAKNCYELLENENDWDIVPDNTSRYTIIIPMKNATVYRFKAENCVKGIYLYSQIFDAVVAECDLKGTEGILLYSVTIPSNGRINPNANVRIVNNRIEGVSPGSNKGGINVRLDSVGTSADKGYGTFIHGVEIKGNTLIDTTPLANHTGKTLTEQSARCGITIDYVGGFETSTDSSSDIKFLTIENNEVRNSQYGVYYEVASSGVVIRNNTLRDTKLSFMVVNARIESAHIINGFEAIDDNETERFPIEIGGSSSGGAEDEDSIVDPPDSGDSGSEIPDDSDSSNEVPDGGENPNDSSSKDDSSDNETEKFPIGGDSSSGEGSDGESSVDSSEAPNYNESSNNSVDTGNSSEPSAKSGCAGRLAGASMTGLFMVIAMLIFAKRIKEREN